MEKNFIEKTYGEFADGDARDLGSALATARASHSARTRGFKTYGKSGYTPEVAPKRLIGGRLVSVC